MEFAETTLDATLATFANVGVYVPLRTRLPPAPYAVAEPASAVCEGLIRPSAVVDASPKPTAFPDLYLITRQRRLEIPVQVSPAFAYVALDARHPPFPKVTSTSVALTVVNAMPNDPAP